MPLRRISRAGSLVAALASALSCGSCGGPSAQAPQAPVSPVASGRPAVVAAPPPPDLGPVPDPPSLVVFGRLARPATSLAMIHGWSHLPLTQADQITELVAGEALGPLVDLDAPIDFAVASLGEGMRLRGLVAVAAGVKDPEAAKAALGEKYKLVPAGNGALLIQGIGRARPQDDDGDEGDDGDGERRTCELAPSYGTPSTRLVCAQDPKALAELGAWLTRTAPRGAASQDLSVEVRLQPLRPTLVAFKRMASVMLGGLLGGRAAAQGTREAVTTMATDILDFATDLDGLSLEVDLAEPAARAKATLRFSENTSTLARLALAHPDGGSAAPASFWQLPSDADLAAFERGIEPGDLARSVRLALKVLDQVLADDGVKEADRKAFLDALAKIPSPAPAAYASGLDAVAVQKAVDGTKDPSAKEPALALSEALLGWRLIEMDEPSSRLAGALKDVAAAWGRPGIAAAYARSKKGKAPAIRAQALPRGVTLPKGALHYTVELALPQDKASDLATPKGGARLTVHVLLAPDGPRTWVGVGGDATLVASKLASAIGAPGAPRAELAPLDQAKVGAAGFFSVRSLPEALVQLDVFGADPLSGALSSLDMVAALPHRGLTPIPFSVTAEPGNVVVATLQVPRGAIEDAVVAALSPRP